MIPFAQTVCAGRSRFHGWGSVRAKSWGVLFEHHLTVLRPLGGHLRVTDRGGQIDYDFGFRRARLYDVPVYYVALLSTGGLPPGTSPPPLVPADDPRAVAQWLVSEVEP